MTSRTALPLTAHRHYQYRGCAPVPPDVADFPGQALGNPELSTGAWESPDPAEQRAAAGACTHCPILDACRTAALDGETGAGGDDVVRGGMLPAERHRLIKEQARSGVAWEQLVDHRHYRYRGCAPSPDPRFPGQALGDPALSIDAWLTPDRAEDEVEPQKVRIARERRAAEACGRCPVLAQCRVYANSETADGRLAEPDGIWGGQLPLDRHRTLIKRRTAAPAPVVVDDVPEARTEQKQAVLRALARETDEELVAYRAGMDVRTANWHRSLLCGLLGLDKDSATRMELLETARRLGLLPKGTRIRPDGKWPVVAAPSGDGVRQRRIAPGMPWQIVLPGYQHLPRTTPSVHGSTGVSGARERLRLVRPAAVQLPLFDPAAAVAGLERAA